MNRVISVDKSILSGGTVSWFVTMEDESGARTRVEVDESAAQRFQQVLQAQTSTDGPRVLTETHP